MALDLGYWEGEKNCCYCGLIDHWSKDCPHKDKPARKFTAYAGSTILGPAKGRTEWEARQQAITKYRKKADWSKIEVR